MEILIKNTKDLLGKVARNIRTAIGLPKREKNIYIFSIVNILFKYLNYCGELRMDAQPNSGSHLRKKYYYDGARSVRRHNIPRHETNKRVHASRKQTVI